MPFLQLKLVSKIELGQSSSCSFSHQGGSIGRSHDCDWTLLDVDRYISNKHVLISYQNEQFILTDISSNGVFINNARTPLGKQNSHILNISDHIKIGSYEIEVEKLNIVDTPQHVASAISQESDSDLLGLVMGEGASSSDDDASYLNIPQSANFDQNSHSSTDDDLGLNDILSGASNYKAPPVHNKPISSFESSPEKQSGLSEPKKQLDNNQHYIANDSSIPEDWELSGILPAIQDYEPPKANIQNPQAVDKEQLFENVKPAEPVLPVPQIEPVAPVEPIAAVEPTTAVEPTAAVEPIAAVEPVAPVEPIQPAVTHTAAASNVVDSVPSPSKERDEQSTGSGSNDFLYTLYNKLGLPKEYLASINEDDFAEDIATVMLSTTKGLMSLLNSRTLFKQESRLSLTSVQPRSNNPIKFSIDPVDTLEMLLLKKKKGYLTAKESYEEAVNDIQLHQMAFLSGLQATLVGVLKQISPEIIEDKVNEKSRSFMGLKANAQYWQLYKEKQELLAKSVTENLNEVLSTYFSEAYQKQINNFKNDKK